MGRKTDKRDKEMSEVQHLKQQVRQLKAQVASLRKLGKKAELDREMVTDILEAETKVEMPEFVPHFDCPECHKGTLQTTTLFRAGEPMQIKICNNCNHRTRLRKAKQHVDY
jgi:transcription elongation factor Elf1